MAPQLNQLEMLLGIQNLETNSVYLDNVSNLVLSLYEHHLSSPRDILELCRKLLIMVDKINEIIELNAIDASFKIRMDAFCNTKIKNIIDIFIISSCLIDIHNTLVTLNSLFNQLKKV